MLIVEIEYSFKTFDDVRKVKTYISKDAFLFGILNGHKIKLIKELPDLNYYWTDHLHDNAICFFKSKPKKSYDCNIGTSDLRTTIQVEKDMIYLNKSLKDEKNNNLVSYSQLLSGYKK